MPAERAVFDTRFFIEHYYSGDRRVLQKTKQEIRRARKRFVSAVVLHEVFWLTLGCEGKETAVLRADLLEKDFRVVDVDAEIARVSAELRHKYGMCLADSVIAATALILKAPCLSDDPHLKSVKEIKTRWI
ncbi:PIN domain-containing protein [Candidatus Bathyarchaeota archaeon]|nr:PIN domain-containing protein [Candidatus Bathyarchaeota archaeon]